MNREGMNWAGMNWAGMFSPHILQRTTKVSGIFSYRFIRLPGGLSCSNAHDPQDSIDVPPSQLPTGRGFQIDRKIVQTRFGARIIVGGFFFQDAIGHETSSRDPTIYYTLKGGCVPIHRKYLFPGGERMRRGWKKVSR
jgi:hypothetical protein